MHPAFEGRLPRERSPLQPSSLIPAAIVVGLALDASIALAIVCIVNTEHLRRTANRIADGASLDAVRLAHDLHHQHVVFLASVIAAGVGVLLLIGWSALAHRVTPSAQGSWGSVVLGWIVPVVNLWAPPRMLARVRAAQLRGLPRSSRARSHVELIYLGWGLLLASAGLVAFVYVDQPGALTSGSAEHESHILTLTITEASVWIASALLLVAAVTVMTASTESIRRGIGQGGPLAPVTPLGLQPPTVSTYPSSIFPIAVHPSDPRWTPDQQGSAPEDGYWR